MWTRTSFQVLHVPRLVGCPPSRAQVSDHVASSSTHWRTPRTHTPYVYAPLFLVMFCCFVICLCKLSLPWCERMWVNSLAMPAGRLVIQCTNCKFESGHRNVCMYCWLLKFTKVGKVPRWLGVRVFEFVRVRVFVCGLWHRASTRTSGRDCTESERDLGGRTDGPFRHIRALRLPYNANDCTYG